MRILLSASLIALVGCIVSTAELAHAQPAVVPPEVKASPAPIAAAEIASSADVASAQLRGLEDRLRDAPEIVEILKNLPEQEVMLAEARERDSERLDTRGLRDLDDLRQTWLRRRAELDAWQTTLQTRFEALAGEHEALDAMDAAWRATRASARETSMPEALVERTRSVIADIATTRKALDARFDELLVLQDRMAQVEQIVDDMLNAVTAATTQARSALLHIDSPPLWQAWRTGGEETNLGAQLRSSISGVRAAVTDWYQTFAPQAWAHVLLTATLALLLVLIRRRTLTWPRDDARVNAAMHVLEHPIASALVVALILTPSMYPRASIIIGELSALALIIPLLRLLPGLVYAPMRRPLYGLAILYTLSRLHTLVLPRSTLDRLLLLVVTVLALIGLVRLLRPGSKTASLSASRWWRETVRAARLAVLVLGVSLIANVIGAGALAELLVEATLASALIAATLLAVVLVFQGLLTVLMRTRRARLLRSVSLYGTLIEARFTRWLNGAALIAWLLATLALFNVIGPIWQAFTQTLSTRWTFGTVDISLGDVLAFFVGVYIAILTSRFVRFVLEEDVFPRLSLARGVPNTISMLVNYTILGLGFLLAIAASGVELSRLTILAGAVGVGVGFGLQNIVNNFLSGLILAFERPVQLGDVIEVDKQIGKVVRIGIRSSTIRTAQGADVIVPNSSLIANTVVNWTLSDRERKVELKLGVAQGNDPARVVKLLTDAVLALPRIAAEPAPIITFDGFGDSTLNFTVRCWGKVDDLLRLGSEVAVGVNEALEKAGIEVPVPQRNLYIHTADAEAAKSRRSETR